MLVFVFFRARMAGVGVVVMVVVAVFVFMLMPVMAMGMRMNELFLAFMRVLMVYMNIELNALDGRFAGSRVMQMVAIESQLPQFLFQPLEIDAKIQKRADKHIAADAAENVQVQSLHRSLRALIWLAAKPAPKPLSIFTTVTPLPQLFNIPSRAASPPKLAP